MRIGKQAMASAILSLSLLSGTIAQAGANVEERQQQISVLQEYRDNYYIVKDKFYLGETGIVAFVKSWAQDASAWSENWGEIWKLVQKAQQPAEAGSVQFALENKLAEQGYQLLELQQRYADFALRSRRVRQMLFQKKIPFNKGDLYEKKIQEMVDANNGLHDHIVSLENSMLQRFNRLPMVAAAAQDRIGVKLEIIMATAPESQKKIVQSLRDALEASKALEPSKRKIQAAGMKVSLALGESRYFAAKRLLESMRVDLDRAVAEVNLLTKVPEERRAAAVTAMRKTYAESSKELARIKTPQIPYQLLTRINEGAVPEAAFECTKPKTHVNCSLANWLGRIPEEKILKYSPVKLEALEDAWTTALNGQDSEAAVLLSKLQGEGDPQ